MKDYITHYKNDSIFTNFYVDTKNCKLYIYCYDALYTEAKIQNLGSKEGQ